MDDFLQRLKQRKLVQWILAYLAAAWVLLQVIDLAMDSYGWPRTVMHIAFGVLAVGFVAMLVLAWYHGERGAQRASGTELLIVALVLAVGGGLLWHFARAPAKPAVAKTITNLPDAAQRSTGSAGLATVAKASSIAAASFASRASTPIAAQPIPAKSVAVLPFENLSADKNNAYFADGMQDLILTKLADIGDLKVIARSSTAKYASHPDDPKTIGQQLGVATILEGSVQKAGNQVLINVQLIDARTDSHIWAKSYTRTLDNIFGVEGEVADKVANALNAKLTPAETARVTQIPTTNTAAYNAFLQGVYYSGHSFIPNSQKLAIGYYRQAVAHDPHFVSAWVHLAILSSGNARDSGSRADAEQAKSALDHAVALAPDSPDVRMAQAWYLDYVKKDLDGALAAFRAVAVSQPNNAQALFGVGVMQAHKGQWEDALGFLQKAIALAPKNKKFLNELVVAYQALHRYPEAVRAAQRLVSVDPSDGPGIEQLMKSYALMGDIGRALATYEKAPADARANPYLTFTYAVMQISHRNYPAARKRLAGLRPVAGLSIRTLELVRGDAQRLSGDTARARAHYLHARALYEAELKQSPESPGARFDFGWVLAQLGQRKEALAQAALGIRELNAKKLFDPFRTECIARLEIAQIQTALGDAGAAVEALDWLLARPTGNHISVPLLKLDPTWDPIRHDPAFQALLKKYGKLQPAASASAGSVATQ